MRNFLIVLIMDATSDFIVIVVLDETKTDYNEANSVLDSVNYVLEREKADLFASMKDVERVYSVMVIVFVENVN